MFFCNALLLLVSRDMQSYQQCLIIGLPVPLYIGPLAHCLPGPASLQCYVEVVVNKKVSFTCIEFHSLCFNCY